MPNYATYAEQEFPKINEAIRESITDLPPLIRPIAEHILLANSKKLRPMLVILFAKLLGYTQPDIYPLSISIEFLHVATLLHDDIIDNSELRRGKTTAHTLFGTTPTILAGDALLAKGNHLVATHGNQQATLAMSETLSQTAYGEIIEIMNQGKILDNTTYFDIIKGKTAWIIRAACELGALKAGASKKEIDAAANFGFNLGIAFQLIDDALDFLDSKTTGKPLGTDIREGKFTLPLSYYIKTLSTEEETAFIKKFKTYSFTEKEIFIISEVIQKEGFDKKVRSAANDYLKKASNNLNLLTEAPNPEYKTILIECLNYIHTRNI